MDIKIVGKDKAKNYQIENKIWRIHFILSDTPPRDWVRIFNVLWDNHFYMMKRHAGVRGKNLYIDCVPEEIEQHHLPELKKIVAETNARFNQTQKAQENDIQRRNIETKTRKNKIDDILDNLDITGKEIVNGRTDN